MPVINTGLVTKGVRSEFFNRLMATPTFYQDLCTRYQSTTLTEQHRWLGSVPMMREWGNGREAKGLRSESYNVTNLKYEATIEVDRDEIADDQTGQILIRAGELAQRAATHKDYLLGLLLENGATTGYNSYDGVTFFNASHASGSSGNQDNDLTSAAATGTQPTAAEMADAVGGCIAAMLAFKDDQGYPMNIGATGLVLVVPPVFLKPALEAMNATLIGSTSNVLQSMARVIVLPHLTSTDKFYLCKTDGIIRPFIFQDREPIEFAQVSEGSEEDFKREKFLYGVRARYAVTYGYWQYCVRHVFT